MERDGINIFQSGFPLAIIATNNNLRNFYGAGQIWPNAVGRMQQTDWIGRVAGASRKAPSPNAFGHEPRTDGALRGAGIR